MSAWTRMLTKRGESFTYKTFSEGSRDAYEDIAYTAVAGTAVQGIRTSVSDPEMRASQPDGEVRRVDIDVLVASGTTVEDNMGTNRPPTLTDASGRVYRILGISLAGVPIGAKRLACEQVFA